MLTIILHEVFVELLNFLLHTLQQCCNLGIFQQIVYKTFFGL